MGEVKFADYAGFTNQSTLGGTSANLNAVAINAANAFFVAAEFALVKVRTTRIEELARTGNRRAKLARGMLDELDEFLSATQLGITIKTVTAGRV